MLEEWGEWFFLGQRNIMCKGLEPSKSMDFFGNRGACMAVALVEQVWGWRHAHEKSQKPLVCIGNKYPELMFFYWNISVL